MDWLVVQIVLICTALCCTSSYLPIAANEKDFSHILAHFRIAMTENS